MTDYCYLWGAGNVGKRALEYLVPLGILKGIIDNDPKKHGQIMHGLMVTDYDTVKPRLKESGVIIAHFDPIETERMLSKDSISHWRVSDFISRWYWHNKQKSAIGFLDFPITTRCTLKCKDCMQYIPFRENLDVPLETLKQELLDLFCQISFVGEISIIGGEPFLHKQLNELLEHIKENYKNRLGSIVITTNGTITPDIRTMELCRETGVYISISDYSKTLPQLSYKIIELEDAAREVGLQIERKRWNWLDTGRFDSEVGVSDCQQTHMQLADRKLWRCTLMAAGNLTNLCTACSEYDYYDLSKNNIKSIQGFLNTKDILTGRTTQCCKCLYPKGNIISCAVQL